MVESDTVYFDRETSGGPLNWQKEEQVGLNTGEYYLFPECQALKHNLVLANSEAIQKQRMHKQI